MNCVQSGLNETFYSNCPLFPHKAGFHRYNAGGSEHIINHPTQKEDYTPNKTSMAADTPPLFFLETGKDFAFHITCIFSSAVRLFSEHAAGELSKDQSQVHLLQATLPSHVAGASVFLMQFSPVAYCTALCAFVTRKEAPACFWTKSFARFSVNFA